MAMEFDSERKDLQNEQETEALSSFYGKHRHIKVAMRPRIPWTLPINDLIGPHIKIDSWGHIILK